MRYLMLVCSPRPGGADPTDEGHPIADAPEPVHIDTWTEDADRRGMRLIGERIRPSEDAVVVRVRDGKVLRSEGGHADPLDLVVGFDVLECDNLDQAVDLAARHPMSRGGVLELRPFWAD